jgi:hypothetical protein
MMANWEHQCMLFHLIAQLIACGFDGALMVFFGNYKINEKLLKIFRLYLFYCLTITQSKYF